MSRQTIDLPKGPLPKGAGPFLCAPAPISLPAGIAQCRSGGPYFARAGGLDFQAVNGVVTEIDIYAEIGFYGVTAEEVRAQLRGAGDVLVRLNSPGGDVFDGIAIYNDLVAHQGRVRVEVTGLAASAASLIAMAGSEIAMAQNAFLMIHDSWTVAVGDSEAMFETGDVLASIDHALAKTYAARTGMEIDAVADLMDAETWLGAEAAVDQGFASEALPFAEPQAAFDLERFRNVPDSLRLYSRAVAGDITTRDLERGLREAGRSRDQARREASSLSALAQRDVAPDRQPRQRDAAEMTRIAASLARLNHTLERK